MAQTQATMACSMTSNFVILETTARITFPQTYATCYFLDAPFTSCNSRPKAPREIRNPYPTGMSDGPARRHEVPPHATSHHCRVCTSWTCRGRERHRRDTFSIVSKKRNLWAWSVDFSPILTTTTPIRMDYRCETLPSN